MSGLGSPVATKQEDARSPVGFQQGVALSLLELRISPGAMLKMQDFNCHWRIRWRAFSEETRRPSSAVLILRFRMRLIAGRISTAGSLQTNGSMLLALAIPSS